MDFRKALISSLEVKFLSFQNETAAYFTVLLNIQQRQKIIVFSSKK